MDTYISCVPSSSSVRWVHVDYKKGKGPEPRYDHAACASNDSNVLYIYGGVSGDGDNCFNDVWSFEIDTCKWTKLNVKTDPAQIKRLSNNKKAAKTVDTSTTLDVDAYSLPTPRWSDVVIIYGGADKEGRTVPDVMWRIDLEHSIWEYIPHVKHDIQPPAVVMDQLWLLRTDPYYLTDDLSKVSIQNDLEHSRAQLKPADNCHCVRCEAGTYCDTVERDVPAYPAAVHQIQHTDLQCSHHSAVLMGSYILIMNGIDCTGARSNAIGVFDTVMMKWYDVYLFTPFYRADVNTVVVDNDVILFGGSEMVDSHVIRVNDGWLLHTSLDKREFSTFMPRPYEKKKHPPPLTRQNTVSEDVVMDVLYPMRAVLQQRAREANNTNDN